METKSKTRICLTQKVRQKLALTESRQRQPHELFERVPAGAKFEFKMILNVFSGDDEKELRQTIDLAIALLEDDYLGGNGSRGYGQVKIEKKTEVKLAEDYGKI